MSKNCVVCRMTGEKSMSILWKLSVENRFNAKIHYLNDWAYEIASVEDAKIISREIQAEGIFTSPIYGEMDGTYSLNWGRNPGVMK